MVVAATPTPERPGAPPPSRVWDSGVVVLGGETRNLLRDRITATIVALEHESTSDFIEFAGQINTEFTPAGARLGIVATSISDLLAKLRRTSERLADHSCRQIRDAAGIYYFDRPLYSPGSLALLYPGEGAQYPGMLADLCQVLPEVEETFAWCDELAAESGRPSLRNVLHPTPEMREEADIELRKLGPSIFGVLVADLAITKVLQNLRIPISAVAGHSAGELAALLASGAMNSESVLGPRLAEIMDLMQRQEDEAGGPDVALLAVGAGKVVVDEVATAVAGGGVLVAMDNCPHQCVAIGASNLVTTLEAALLRHGFVCERLPFRRPYHTPLFEPWMTPFRDLFADVPFAAPHTPVYCCSTGVRFPDDGNAIRSLTVNHWVNPVEFTRMIKNMHADGIRLFIEAGPRGNLSAFVEDILRGESFAAIPANVPRKSGPTQINHLVAQLTAHHVPLELGYLNPNQTATPHEWRKFERASNLNETVEYQSPVPATGSTAAIMDGYLAVMKQYLDVQRKVMEAFLSGQSPDGPLLPDCFQSAPVADSMGVEAEPQEPFALVGRVEHFEPGRLIIFRRVMDAHEDRYSDDHTLGGRGVSRCEPKQNGLPVLPMTFSLEAMAEAASLLAPGKVVTSICNVRLFRWLPFDSDPTTLEVRAQVSSADTDRSVVEVKADVRDLGNSFINDGANKPASEAIIVLSDEYPEPPEPLPFRLTNETTCRSTVEDLRRNMFHGPLFQMIRSLGRIGPEGIEGSLEVQPRDGWFRSNPAPRTVIDPVLTDAAMHLLGAWHLEQPDWTGRILLPFEVQKIDYFAPPPEVGTHLIVRGHNEHESARHFRHGLEVLDVNGRLWLRMTGAGYWRFYLPFGHVNFFGPKDEYFLSRDWPEAVPPSETGSPPRRCHFLEPPVDLKQPVLRAAGARVTMTPRELAEFQGWKGTEPDLNDWLFGRMLAKDAVRAAWAQKHGEAMFPADIETVLVNGRIVCQPRGGSKCEPFPPVAVAVADGIAAAFSAFAPNVGIAMSRIAKGELEEDVKQRLALQALRNGLGINDDQIELEHGDSPDAFLVHHQNRRCRVQTARHKDVVVATMFSETETP